MIIFIDILKFILLVLATFFTLQIITDKNKLVSYIGTLLICFSTAILEYINSGLVEAIFFGELIFISVDKLLLKEKWAYLYSIMISLRIIRIFITFKYKFSNTYWNFNYYFNNLEVIRIL